MKKEYGNDSITSLKGADRVRKRPAVIFGSDGLEGCQHSVFEILSNSIDEAREGHGRLIVMERFADDSIKVSDQGRGVPVDYNEKEQKFNWELVFCELYAGGKYKNNSGDNYEYSLGLNGLGACATQYSSEFMNVTVYRDGYKYSLHFEKGENVGGLTKEEYAHKQTGTQIHWKPDRDVFTEIEIPSDYFITVMKKQAVVNKGIKFRFIDYKNKLNYEYCYPEGIVDYIKEFQNEKGFSEPHYIETEKKGRDREDKPEYKVKLSCAFCFNNEVNLLEYYHNSSFLEHGGSPDKAVRTAFVYAIDKLIKNANKYNKNESKITFVDVEDSLILVSNSFSTETSYENQTKKAITNKFIQEAMTDFLKQQLDIYFVENRAVAEKVVNQILINKRSRENAEKARVSYKKKLTGNTSVTDRVQKFVDCRSKDPELRELFIVEGDSALGACKQSRNSEFQAIIPVRGKILNCLKSEYDRIFKSDIITDLIKVIGCGVEVPSKHKSGKDMISFNIDLLRWSKIIICTDADVDGFQIRTLILTMIYRLMPTLIKEGKVYIAESPLYEVRYKDETWFCYTEKEKADVLAELGNVKYTIQRSKGLGENDADMMWLTTMNPQTRRLIKVEPNDVEELIAEKFELLLGDNLAERKEFIAENGVYSLEIPSDEYEVSLWDGTKYKVTIRTMCSWDVNSDAISTTFVTDCYAKDFDGLDLPKLKADDMLCWTTDGSIMYDSVLILGAGNKLISPEIDHAANDLGLYIKCYSATSGASFEYGLADDVNLSNYESLGTVTISEASVITEFELSTKASAKADKEKRFVIKSNSSIRIYGLDFMKAPACPRIEAIVANEVKAREITLNWVGVADKYSTSHNIPLFCKLLL